MSPSGQKQKSGDGVLTSALPPTTEVLGRMSEAGGEAEVILGRWNFRVRLRKADSNQYNCGIEQIIRSIELTSKTVCCPLVRHQNLAAF